jgi:hypothetical protein
VFVELKIEYTNNKEKLEFPIDIFHSIGTENSDLHGRWINIPKIEITEMNQKYNFGWHSKACAKRFVEHAS